MTRTPETASELPPEPSANARPVIQFEDVCFAYNREEVLHNISLSVPGQTLTAVVGPNGAGKSTFVKLTLGLLSPGRGRVRVFGDAPVRVRRRIGYVPQHIQFDWDFPVSALDVVLMGRAEKHWIGPYRRIDRDKAEKALVQVQLQQLARRSFSSLSGGERQRVLIAQALVANPEILLLDEPTANVDTQVEHEIYELLHELNRQMTIVVVSHNLNVVTRHASHLLCVNRVASLCRMTEMTEDRIHAFYRGDLAMLQHSADCQIFDPSNAMREPHHDVKGEKRS
jgi:zinc transport system ATP-binding protein